ncbi:General amino acid permease AGP2 [Fusarium oxysporum f. sp. albedinis]|nr:General amino acid permease AGP2 [Fusarium oxysporum f. sp. albedinis]
MSHMLRQLHLGYPLIGSLPQSLRWTSSPCTNNFQPLHPVDSLEVHEAAINSCGTMDLKKGIETDNSKGGYNMPYLKQSRFFALQNNDGVTIAMILSHHHCPMHTSEVSAPFIPHSGSSGTFFPRRWRLSGPSYPPRLDVHEVTTGAGGQSK